MQDIVLLYVLHSLSYLIMTSVYLIGAGLLHDMAPIGKYRICISGQRLILDVLSQWVDTEHVIFHNTKACIDYDMFLLVFRIVTSC